MIKLSPLATSALEALGTYHYLSASQLSRAGVGASARTAREKALDPLVKRQKPLVHCQPFGWVAGVGRLENIYQLTNFGARTLAEIWRCSESDIQYPKSQLKYQKDYQHRKGVVDLHIALRTWSNQTEHREVQRFDPYYFRPGKRPLTQIRLRPDPALPPEYAKVIEPDAIIEFTDNGKSTLAAVELHWATDTRKIGLQLDRHITALSQNLIAERYQSSKPHIVYSVHQNPATRRSVQKWFKENEEAAAFEPFFRWFDFDPLLRCIHPAEIPA